MALEIRLLNEGIAAERKPLSRLLAEERPSTVTKTGGEYLFRKDVLEHIAGKIPRDMHGRLRLPILFHTTADVPDSCCLTDEAAVQALRHLGELSELRTMHKGKLWVSRAIAGAIMVKYPTAVQMVIGY
jgi:uncharacterized protein (UPF0216 family)